MTAQWMSNQGLEWGHLWYRKWSVEEVGVCRVLLQCCNANVNSQRWLEPLGGGWRWMGALTLGGGWGHWEVDEDTGR